MARVLKQEEERFAETLDDGMALLEDAIGEAKGRTIAGETVFKLYDTYGFPVDLTADIARERGLVDRPVRLRAAMEPQRETRPRGEQVRRRPARARRRSMPTSALLRLRHAAGRGPRCSRSCGRSRRRPGVHAGEEVQVVLDSTPFYAESGGQVGDIGTLSNGPTARFRVATRGSSAMLHVHVGRVEAGSFRKGDRRHGAGRPRDAPGDRAQPLRHAPAARGAAQGARHARDRRRARWSRPTACASTSRTTQPVTAQELATIERLVNAEIRAQHGRRNPPS